ncbi:hypothetical protein H0A61_00033 [Koleobacter methoxysyntrophicus]|uniref:Sulfate exporter family transporter n=1 Tax=Koleobacter methoxysyntrophicus TaxID=2751313 RepID=A0A8A0RJL5_9FIRM|nr:YeiH family protein [Koleobacter methoxysyntrophicus]QSQ07717.1 hypothetical protein H0A61_00033 [Koleobacter methoxysyntrophicus]
MNVKKYLNGVLVVGITTISSFFIQEISFIERLNFSSLIIAILLGALIKNTIGINESMKPGIKLCAKKVLRLAIIFLGFKLSISQITKIGPKAIILIFIVCTSTMIFTKYLGKKFKIPEKRSILIGSGISICGASAVAAVNAVTKSDKKDAAFAIGIVTVFGTIFMFIYPIIFKILDMSTSFYTLWTGSSIHEVAQVVAAGFAVSNDAGTYATLVKLTRVLYIIPVTIYLSIKYMKESNSEKFSLKNVSVPWFVFMFLAVVIINSFISIPSNVLTGLIDLDNYLMTAAMAGLGLELSISDMKKVGIKPLYLGTIASLFISILSAVVIKLMGLA